MKKFSPSAKNWIWVAIGIFAILLILPIFCNCYYLTVDSFLNTIENYYTLVIALGGVVGVIINLIYTRKRIDLQGQQLANQDKQLRNEQFTAAVTQLGHESESVRLGGIYSLYALAEEYPKEYLNNVCDIFCAHIRTTTRKPQYQIDYKEEPSTEIQTIIDFLFKKRNEKKPIFNSCDKNLSKSYFAGVDFIGGAISKSNFYEATISKSFFISITIYSSSFIAATISESNFYGSIISKSVFWQATISESNFNKSTISKDCRFTEATIDDETLNTFPEELREQIEKHRKK